MALVAGPDGLDPAGVPMPPIAGRQYSSTGSSQCSAPGGAWGTGPGVPGVGERETAWRRARDVAGVADVQPDEEREASGNARVALSCL